MQSIQTDGGSSIYVTYVGAPPAGFSGHSEDDDGRTEEMCISA
jgi:hypothetical protein